MFTPNQLSVATCSYRRLTLDIRDLGETCGKHRVA